MDASQQQPPAIVASPVPSTRPKGALIAAIGGMAATIVTAVACVGPLAAILLGVGGLGFLTQYTYLRVPATVLTFTLLGVGFAVAYQRKYAECARRRVRSVVTARILLWVGLALAVAVNLFEYVIFPRLA